MQESCFRERYRGKSHDRSSQMIDAFGLFMIGSYVRFQDRELGLEFEREEREEKRRKMGCEN